MPYHLNTAHLDLDLIDLRILRLVLILSNTQSLTKTAAAMKLSVRRPLLTVC